MSDKLLSTVPVPLKEASIFSATCLPVMKGSDKDNLLCGSCSVVLAEGVSEQTLATRFAVQSELLLRCPKCGALNELPARWCRSVPTPVSRLPSGVIVEPCRPAGHGPAGHAYGFARP